jgi:peptidoglycan/LPS O-acetylase OafA/YrhL
MARTGEIDEIDGLRGVAIFMVMVHRLWPRDAVNRLSVAADAGWIGVDLFFVVSGFLITRILLETRGEPGYFRNFYARRVLRIFPLYYLFVGTLLVAFPLMGNAQYLETSGSPFWYLTFLGNVPEGLLGYDPPYWLGPVWSLAIEEQFYLTFPLIVLWLGPTRLGPFLIGLFLLAPVARVVTMQLEPDAERIQYLFTLCRVDSIAAGCLIALVMRCRNVQALRGLAIMIACCAGAIAIIGDLDRTTTFGRVAGYSFVAIGFAALLVAVLTSRDRWWTAPLRLAPLRYCGKLCFGLYLLHRPADTFVTVVANRFDVDADRISWIPIKIAVAIVLATMSWFVIEKPFLRLKRRFASPRHPAAFAITIVLLATAACHAVPGVVARDDAAPPAPDARVKVDVAEAADAATGSSAPVLYVEGRRHSPITPAIVAHLQAVAGKGLDARVFAKIGDSITDTPSFATCFDGGNVDLGAHGALAPTIGHFMQGRIGSATPFARDSLAAQGGWIVQDVLDGMPCALDRELNVAQPQLAVVLLGTNDNRYGRSLDAFATDLWELVDRLLARGVVPIVSTLPPLRSYPAADARVPAFNHIVRAIAQGRGIPLVDLYSDMLLLPQRGISSDGIHPTVAPSGACVLTAGALAYGYNTRNLVTLEALARTRAALDGIAADATAPTREGAGTTSDPYLASLPLVDLGDTRSGAAVIDTYAPCGTNIAFGHEVVYAVEAPTALTIDAFVVDRDANVDLYIFAASAQGPCVGSGDANVTATVPAGTFYVVVDAPSAAADGEYLLVVTAR